MIKIIGDQEVKSVCYTMLNENIKLADLHLVKSSITNKFYIPADFVSAISCELGDEFDLWLSELMKRYVGCEQHENIENVILTRYKILSDAVPHIKKYVDEYIRVKQIDFSVFVNEKKQKKTSIIFNKEEIEYLHKLCSYLKIYSLFSNSENLRLNNFYHRKIFNKILNVSEMNSGIINKILEIIKVKSYRYNLSDKYMWEYIKMVRCKDMDIHILDIFNFIMNNMLVLCQLDKNPITFFVSIINDSINWLLRNIYIVKIVYEDEVQSKDIFQRVKHNNLKTYVCNNTLKRVKLIAFDNICKEIAEQNDIILLDDYQQNEVECLDNIDKELTRFNNKILSIEFLSPVIETLLYPILSSVLSIPYRHLTNLTVEYATILSYYVSDLLKKVFKDEYNDLFCLLKYYPIVQPPVSTTYRVRNLHEFFDRQEDYRSFYGFNARLLDHDLISFFIGRISKQTLRHIVTDKPLESLSVKDIENDSIGFYEKYFGDKLSDEINQLRELVYRDL